MKRITFLTFAILFLICSLPMRGQNPDCFQSYSFRGAGTSNPEPNLAAGCQYFTIFYQASGFSALSIQFETANGTNTPGTFSAATAATGSNPNTNTTTASATFTALPGWYRINATSVTGTGQIIATVIGYRTSRAAGGPPTGAAGGDLSGTYPNPTVINLSNVTNGSLSNSGLQNDAITVNTVPCTLGGSCNISTAPSGAAGGDLTGSYPNPGVGQVNGAAVPTSAAVTKTNASKQFVAAAAADVVSLFSTCSGTQYLGADGACHTPSSGGGTGCSGTNTGNGTICLEEHTASSSAELDFTQCFSSSYDTYRIAFSHINVATANAYVGVQISTNAGSSYITTGYGTANYVYGVPGGGANGNAPTATGMIIMFADGSNNGLSSSTLPSLEGELIIQIGSSLPVYAFGSGIAVFNSNSLRYHFDMGSLYSTSVTPNAFRVLASSGNLASGTVRCYAYAQ